MYQWYWFMYIIHAMRVAYRTSPSMSLHYLRPACMICMSWSNFPIWYLIFSVLIFLWKIKAFVYISLSNSTEKSKMYLFHRIPYVLSSPLIGPKIKYIYTCIACTYKIYIHTYVMYHGCSCAILRLVFKILRIHHTRRVVKLMLVLQGTKP